MMFLTLGMVLVSVVLALLFVPARTQAEQLSVAPGVAPTATFSFAGPTYVTMHFANPGNYGMRYWMSGPSGMMYDRSMMGSGMMGGESASYSFWTWGGEYTCGAAYSADGAGSMPVWVNATSAIL